jgi:heat shock protein HslJ
MLKLTLFLSAMLFIGACSKDPIAPETLNADWQIKKLGTRDVSKFGATLTLDIDRKSATGTSSCNSYGAIINIVEKHQKITFANIVSSKLSCKNENALFEVDFFDALKKVKTYELSDDKTMKLVANDGGFIEIKK